MKGLQHEGPWSGRGPWARSRPQPGTPSWPRPLGPRQLGGHHGRYPIGPPWVPIGPTMGSHGGSHGGTYGSPYYLFVG